MLAGAMIPLVKRWVLSITVGSLLAVPGVQAAALGLDIRVRAESWSSSGSEFLNGDSLEFVLRIDEADVRPSVDLRDSRGEWDWTYASVSGELVILVEGRELARSAAAFWIRIHGGIALEAEGTPPLNFGRAYLNAYEIDEPQLVSGVLPASAGTRLNSLGVDFTVPVESDFAMRGDTLTLRDLLAAADVTSNRMAFDILTMRGFSPLWMVASQTHFGGQIEVFSVDAVPEPGTSGLLGVAIVSVCCARGRLRRRAAMRVRS